MNSLVCLSLIFLSAIAGEKSIFGGDNRVVMSSRVFPWSAIGKLEGKDSEGPSHCTATLVGRDILLTNSHCVHDESGRLKTDLEFHANVISGVAIIKSKARLIVAGHKNWGDHPDLDWALLRLDRPLGEALGFMTIAERTELGSGVTLAGYSGDFQAARSAGVHQDCELKRLINRETMVFHDCDMTKGSSGSAIFRLKEGAPIIHALNSAQRKARDRHPEWKEEISNLSVPTMAYYNAWLSALNEMGAKSETALIICNQSSSQIRTETLWYSSNGVSKGAKLSLGSNRCKEFKIPKELLGQSASLALISGQVLGEITPHKMQRFDLN
jgi:protease YdgD